MSKSTIKILGIIMFITTVNSVNGNSLNQIEGIWEGEGNDKIMVFLPDKKRGDFCLDIKAKEGKAYFYVKTIDNPIQVKVESVGEFEYLFTYRNKKQYARFDKNILITFSGKLNMREYDNSFSFYDVKKYNGLKTYDNLVFEPTVKGCLKFIEYSNKRDEERTLD